MSLTRLTTWSSKRLRFTRERTEIFKYEVFYYVVSTFEIETLSMQRVFASSWWSTSVTSSDEFSVMSPIKPLYYFIKDGPEKTVFKSPLFPLPGPSSLWIRSICSFNTKEMEFDIVKFRQTFCFLW